MTGFFGFDNRVLLPPFFPVQRNADGIFGLILQKCMKGSYIAFLPSVLLHEPAAERMFESDQIWTDAGSVRMADVVIACVFASGAGGEHLTGNAIGPTRETLAIGGVAEARGLRSVRPQAAAVPHDGVHHGPAEPSSNVWSVAALLGR
jgi:hypothetical protein